MKIAVFKPSDSFAKMDLQLQNDLLVELIQRQEKLIHQQEALIEELRHVVQNQSVEIEALKSEVRRLKGLKTKPKIRASKMNKGDDSRDNENGNNGEKRPGSKKRSKRDSVVIHKTEIIKSDSVPEGAIFKGYQTYIVQGLEIKVENRLFKLERWKLPDGRYQVAELPAEIKGHHFSAELRSYILHQHHHQGVTQPLLLAQLREWGVDISSGQLNRILTEDKEVFHKEKRAILAAGLSVSSYIQVDDTGARHRGKNGYCTHIGNELFAWFESTERKSRINFLNLLNQGRRDYIVDEQALSYMKKHKLAPKYRAKLIAGIRRFDSESAWAENLRGLGITGSHHQRIATEGALIGSLLHHGVRSDLAILSDDAGQFNIFQHALCWIHAERKINELIPKNDMQLQAINDARETFWCIYNALKTYKKELNESSKEQIEQQFDSLVHRKTDYVTLNLILERMRRNKKELLLVLERPEIPLHNNLSERDIREYVKKRKISGSTRSDEGRRCRDTFTSLKKTCKKLGVGFWNYLTDRVSGKNAILPLDFLITQKASPAI